MGRGLAERIMEVQTVTCEDFCSGFLLALLPFLGLDVSLFCLWLSGVGFVSSHA